MKFQTPHILILDDEELIIKQLKEILLHKGYVYVHTATEIDKAREIFLQNKIDIFLSDIFLSKNQSGIDFVRELRKDYIFSLIFLSGCEESTFEKTLPLNPEAYIAKPFSAMQIITTIKTVWHNEQNKVTQSHDEELQISSREMDVLQLLSTGRTSKEIAEQLHLSVFTVQNHKSRMRQKFNALNSHDLISKAYQLGYLKRDS